MSAALPNSKALEEIWRLRLEDSKLRLDFARTYLKEVIADFPLKETSDSDGHYTHQRAIMAESSALREYVRVLGIFTRLTVHGVIPDDAEWLREPAAGGGRQL